MYKGEEMGEEEQTRREGGVRGEMERGEGGECLGTEGARRSEAAMQRCEREVRRRCIW